ncbi:hypothetical protein H6P81_015662 [Aristolochia fimbriata]|uniref:Reverse transcriptase/retrotransposon-derived protein RNase H-like domain-containing protein n=1 Tax=Aristolochia fimbriata TaxID=158543 RepID=A0AAV7E6A6_ARIFI|nr:hypothetical protein H6P81_015662 [Aristolochia fimbriata]
MPGATYQRAMQNIFDDFLHKRIECYVGDLVVKTKREPTIFSTSGDAGAQKRLELKSFQGHHAYIRRFISNLAGRCQPFSRLLKKGTPLEWGEACRNAFNNIKAYLTKPPVLSSSDVDKPPLLYIAKTRSRWGALLAQCDEDNKERSLYYLSRTLVGAELNYTPIEKTCLALIFAVQKLRHYLLAHSTNLISRADPLKYIMSRPILSGRLGEMGASSLEFEINLVPQRAIKGRRNIPGRSTSPWEMYFGGAKTKKWSWRRSPFRVSKEGSTAVIRSCYPTSVRTMKRVSSHPPRTRYSGRDATAAIKYLLATSALVIKQLSRVQVKKLRARTSRRYAGELLAQIPEVSLHYVPRSENGPADALAGIAASLARFDERPNQVPIYERWVIPPPLEEEKEREQTEETEESLPISATQNQTEDWRKPIINFLRHSTLPVDLRERVQIRRTAPRYVFINDILYRRSYEGTPSKCLEPANRANSMPITYINHRAASPNGGFLAIRSLGYGYHRPYHS